MSIYERGACSPSFFCCKKYVRRKIHKHHTNERQEMQILSAASLAGRSRNTLEVNEQQGAVQKCERRFDEGDDWRKKQQVVLAQHGMNEYECKEYLQQAKQASGMPVIAREIEQRNCDKDALEKTNDLYDGQQIVSHVSLPGRLTMVTSIPARAEQSGSANRLRYGSHSSG